MKPLNLEILSINAKKEKNVDKKIDLKTSFDIGKSEKKELILPDESIVYSFNFTYSIDYEEYANITIKGNVLFSVDQKTSEGLESEQRVLPNKFKSLILNFVLFKLHTELLHIEEKLGLPFHIPSPTVSVESKQ